MSDMPEILPTRTHLKDEYGYAELIGAPPLVMPDQDWLDEVIVAACPECSPNIALVWQPEVPADAPEASKWDVKVAHDDTCSHFVAPKPPAPLRYRRA